MEIDALANGERRAVVPYDTLIVAGGSRYSFFGHDEWRQFALEVKSLESALEVRSRIFTAFEAAEAEHDSERRAAWLTFVVVGGGPTGVEMAGQIAELARDALPREFRSADIRQARILLVETTDRVLGAFPPRLSAKAARALERLGVTVMLGTTRHAYRCRVGDVHGARLARSRAARRAPSSGRRAWSHPSSPECSPPPPAPSSTAPGGSRSGPASRCTVATR